MLINLIKVVFGLGNPGLRYKNTRHNLGFLTVDYLAQNNKIKFNKKSLGCIWGEGEIFSKKIFLAKPQTFMNLSGEAVRCFIDYFGFSHKEILVIIDDLNLKLGDIRLRTKGTSGGHKGLASTIASLNTKDFSRLRVGVGCEFSGESADFVLRKFNLTEHKKIKVIIPKAAEVVEYVIDKGLDAGMNRYNVKISNIKNQISK